MSAICTLIAAGAVTTNLTWRDSNNVNHTMTPAQMIQLAGGMATHGQTIYQASWTHKANIELLTSLSAVISYDNCQLVKLNK